MSCADDGELSLRRQEFSILKEVKLDLRRSGSCIGFKVATETETQNCKSSKRSPLPDYCYPSYSEKAAQIAFHALAGVGSAVS